MRSSVVIEFLLVAALSHVATAGDTTTRVPEPPTTTTTAPVTTTTPRQTTTHQQTTTAATPVPTSYCHTLTRQTCQTWNGCFWCPTFGQGNNGTCQEVGSSTFCTYCEDVAKAIGSTCLQLNDNRCRYCYSSQQCAFQAAQQCVSCDSAQNTTQCAAFASPTPKTLPGCHWCALTTTCDNAQDFATSCHCSTQPRDVCLQFPTLCTYCPVQQVCQRSSEPCATCAAIDDDDTCVFTNGCSFCDVTNRCYTTSGNYSCPMSCASLSNNITTCLAAHTCLWCIDMNTCIPQSTPCDPCSYQDQYNCNQLATTACQWCPFLRKCQRPASVCPATCGAIVTQSQCGFAPGCSYCTSTLSCQNDGDQCYQCSGWTEDSCFGYSGCGWCAFTQQCMDASSLQLSCPTTCGTITESSSCAAVPNAVCAWCYADGSYSGSGTESCWDTSFCTSGANYGGLSLGGLIGVVIASVVVLACTVTICSVWCRRRRAQRAAQAAALAPLVGGGSIQQPSGQPPQRGVAAAAPVMGYGAANYTTAIPVTVGATLTTNTA